jgi:signal-transduction protein with cAMP-binding, CBS, and nucleotidyltransferase domain
MEVMTNQHIRHLPVVQNGALAGIVSIGDSSSSVWPKPSCRYPVY